MRFQIVTLFPERYRIYTESGLPARALKKGLFSLAPVQLRDFADPERKGRVDDMPYGGGPGMVLQIGPVDRALAAMERSLPVILFTPRGERLNQSGVRRFYEQARNHAGLTLVCGYYEGVDERIARHLVDYEVSLGDFILGSGDLAALCFIEAITRLIPGYMGSEESAHEESNENGLLEYPQYTRPADYNGWKVPDVLLSGHHGEIERWRLKESHRITEYRNLKR